MRFKRLRNKALVYLVALSLLLFPFVSGSVASQTFQISVPPRVSVKTVTPEVSAALLAKVLHSSRFQELKAKYDVDQLHTVIQRFSINGKDVTTVCIPIKDNTGYSYSKYIVQYDSDGNYIDSLLFAFQKTGSTYDFIAQNDHIKVKANIAENGSILSGAFTDEHGQQNDLIPLLRSKGLEGNKKPNPLVSLLSPRPAYAAGWWSCFNNCLASQGVPSWVITGISIACGLICIGTAGTACVWCILTAAAGWGAIGLTCAEYCWGLF
jgi:hypothetical protein